uniref:Uncharacterized protein n=1 Tax=Anguilla anguilla TaxID=7936 RepID=A0A0E9WRX0_ANGAN
MCCLTGCAPSSLFNCNNKCWQVGETRSLYLLITKLQNIGSSPVSSALFPPPMFRLYTITNVLRKSVGCCPFLGTNSRILFMSAITR